MNRNLNKKTSLLFFAFLVTLLFVITGCPSPAGSSGGAGGSVTPTADPVLELGIPVEGDLSTGGELREYTLNVEQDQGYLISWDEAINSSTYDANIDIAVFNQDGSRIEYEGASPIMFTANTTDTFKVRVIAVYSGNYRLRVDSSTPPTSISLSPGSVSLKSGDTQVLTLNTIPSNANQNVEWASSDTDIVTVSDNGLITAHMPGSVQITATSLIDGDITGSCDVSVGTDPISVGIPVEGEIGYGKSDFYALSVIDGVTYDISWKDSSPYTARVRVGLYDRDNNVLRSMDSYSPLSSYTADFDGTVYIEVKEYLSSGTYQLTVSCDLAPTSLAPQEGSLILTSGETSQVILNALPTGASTEAGWSSSDSDVVYVDHNGMLRAEKPGTAVITAVSDEDSSVSTTVDVTVQGASISPGTSVDGTILNNAYLYYRLEVVEGRLYRISWNETSPYTSSIRVGLQDSTFTNIKSYDTSTPLTDYIAESTGYVYIVIEEYTDGSFQLSVESYSPPSSLSLSETSVSLELGDSMQLSATPAPVDASGEVDWVSSDGSVATVDSSGLINAVGPGAADITATSIVDGTVSEVCAVTVVEPAKASSWTVMYYSDADNDLEPFLMEDIQEIKGGLQPGADINVVLLVDRIPGETSESAALGSNFTDTRLYRLLPGKSYRIDGGSEFPEITKTSTFEANMGDPETLQKFIQFCKAEYPADHYALFMSNHGGGARNTRSSSIPLEVALENEKDICFDETSDNDALYTAEITDVLSSSESVDLMVFDACLMATVEVAYQYSPDRPGATFGADYLLASAPTVWGYGLEYENAFQRINTSGGNNGNTDSTMGGSERNFDPESMTPVELAAVFLEEQRDSVNLASVDHQSFTLLNLSLLDEVKTAVDALAVNLTGLSNKLQMESARGSYSATSVMNYFDESDEIEWIVYPYFDLYDLASATVDAFSSSTVDSAASDVMSAVSNAVLYSFGGTDYAGFSEGNSGLSIFFPDGDRLQDGADAHWGYQWWYSSVYTPGVNPDLQYGKLAWCIDGQNAALDTVGNWFELLDSWFDDSNDASGGYNLFQW